MSSSGVSYFGLTNHRLPGQPFGVKQADRLFHLYALGKTGTGKTTLLEFLALQDILRGRGVMVIDPHGDLADRLVSLMPAGRVPDLIYLNAPDTAPLDTTRYVRSE